MNPDGTPGTVATTYAYDAAGNLVSQAGPLGRVTRMGYDAALAVSRR
jgi:YD repeat-containing protein